MSRRLNAAVDTAAARVARWLTAALATNGRSDYRWAFGVFAGVLVTFSALAIAQGPCLQLFYGHDDIGFLAAAWRVRNGCLPSADYYSALGALNPWIHAAGMWVLGPTATVIPVCNTFIAAALGLLAWTVAARRLPAVLAAVFAVTQFTTALTPHLLRFDWYAATYDGYYNRQCYALIGTLLLLLFLPRCEGDARTARRDDALAGTILGVLLFVKVSYFMVGVGLYTLAFVLGGRSIKKLPWTALLAFGAVFLLCLPLIRFDLAAMAGDLRMAAAARPGDPHSAMFTVSKYFGRIGEAWIEAGLLVILQFFLRPQWWWRRGADAGASMPAPSWAEFAGIVCASAFLCMTNSPGGEHSETPLLTDWVFVLLGCIACDPSIADPARRLPPTFRPRDLAPAFCMAGFLWVYTFGNGFACLCWAMSPVRTGWQQTAWRDSPAFDSASLAALRIHLTGGESGDFRYADKVNDGLRLLRALGGTHRVEALDFVNPFPFALQWPVTRGGLWCWHIGFSFSPDAHPSAEEVFGESDVVMVPKQPGEVHSCKALRAIYGSYIEQHYQLASESDYWFVMRRR